MAIRTRRNAMKQAEDALAKLFVKQEAVVTKLREQLEAAKAEADATRRAFAALHQEELPGMEIPAQPIGEGGTGHDLTRLVTWSYGTDTGAILPIVVVGAENTTEAKPAQLYAQRIGEKAQTINDVWPLREGAEEVHTSLMYSRQVACSWCRKGVPFNTEERTEHYIAGVPLPFLEKCKGAE